MAKSKPRRSARGVDLNQPLSDQPWYVKTLVWVGVPTVAFGYLLWFVLGDMSGGMKAMRESMDQHQKDMASLIQHLQAETDQQWVQLGVTQRICINTARTDADRLACVSIARRTGQ